MRETKKMLVLDPDYDYGRHENNSGFTKYVTLRAITKAIWRALNPELNHIRNIKEYTKWRNLNRDLYRIRNRLHEYHNNAARKGRILVIIPGVSILSLC
jgi:hypothetical protein